MKKLFYTLTGLLLAMASLTAPVQAAEEASMSKYQAVQMLLQHFQIQPNPLYQTPLPVFQQYFRDVWPANPYYGYINTACELNVLTCDKESFFDGESSLSVPAFLKILYQLKWRDDQQQLENKIYTYRGQLWYAPYWREATRTNLISPLLPPDRLSFSTGLDILRRDTALSFYRDSLDYYFDGLEYDTTKVTPERYYNPDQLRNILATYTELLAMKKTSLDNISGPEQKKKVGEQLSHLATMQNKFSEVAKVVAENPLLYDPTVPEAIKQTALSYGIHEKIGESTYDYSSSPGYRRFNIKTALDKINGKVLQPGEEFNFASIIYDHGLREFKMGWVINGGREEQAVGGGICGAATATFQAAYRSGLQITERREHTIFYKSFYPMDTIGLDAAVYKPRPNLRFVNNTGYPLLIYVAYPSEHTANIQMLGTKHFDVLTLEGPNLAGRNTRWVRTIQYKDGTTGVEELKSHFGQIK